MLSCRMNQIQWIGRQAGRHRGFEGGLTKLRTSTHLEASLILSSELSELFRNWIFILSFSLVLHTFPDSSRAEPSKGEAFESRMMSDFLFSLCLGWGKSVNRSSPGCSLLLLYIASHTYEKSDPFLFEESHFSQFFITPRCEISLRKHWLNRCQISFLNFYKMQGMIRRE